MKQLISTLVILFSANSYAFTEKLVYACGNNEEVVVQTSLNPKGGWIKSAYSETFGYLKNQDCSQMESQWSAYGSEVCYANQKALLSLPSKNSPVAVLKIIQNDRKYFTVCELVETIQ